jgi:hypothetical protein
VSWMVYMDVVLLGEFKGCCHVLLGSSSPWASMSLNICTLHVPSHYELHSTTLDVDILEKTGSN